MGLQKFRVDESQLDEHGVVVHYTVWMGGPSIAKLSNCPTPFGRRTVYVTGEADTFFTIPAACRFRGKSVSGFLTCKDQMWEFHAYTRSHWFPHITEEDES